ncbi:MAG: gamma-glutamylcyclotransferase [Ignavibacteriae bacterium]|nr:gamma-glutamylcyclotransferase [Ignavibacteriota bacterium]
MIYFAYGSNMSLKRLSSRVSIKKTIGIGQLFKYKLMFHKISSDGCSGKCDAYYTGEVSDIMFGVIYEIEDSELNKLDKYEGVGDGYKRKSILLKTYPDNTECSAITYCTEKINSELKPFSWYTKHVIVGAIENKLPEYYIDKIKAVETIKDKNKEREEEQLSIYS